ncbi:hypothetical protein DFH07DRAFT_349137 [Mycena maculata]|uniref:BAG domain-containing protein n=1 Tax=Mycena maculata TaxID=230809 RepID=A0AAD7MGT9_9AGAR|nr:hypothetical protein DFH07DRAFT_349137 [Mycena maculata]
MFAPLYSNYPRETVSPRARYVSALSKVQQAEIEYATYLAQQERERVQVLQQQQRRARVRQAEIAYAAYLVQKRQERARVQQQQQARKNEQARRLQIFVLHTTISSLLQAREQDPKGTQRPISQAKPTPTPNKSSGAQLDRKPRVCPVRQQATARPIQAVRNALGRRLASERNFEVHATIQRLLSTLSDTPVSQPPSLKAVTALETAFRALAADFVFPPRLDFPSSTSVSTPCVSALPHTPRNAPLRQYEAALNALLERLDAVESGGDVEVQRARGQVVRMVEGALEGLERVLEGRRKLLDVDASGQGSSASPREVKRDESEAAAASALHSGGSEPDEQQESGQQEEESSSNQTPVEEEKNPMTDLQTGPDALTTELPEVPSTEIDARLPSESQIKTTTSLPLGFSGSFTGDAHEVPSTEIDLEPAPLSPPASETETTLPSDSHISVPAAASTDLDLHTVDVVQVPLEHVPSSDFDSKVEEDIGPRSEDEDEEEIETEESDEDTAPGLQFPDEDIVLVKSDSASSWSEIED